MKYNRLNSLNFGNPFRKKDVHIESHPGKEQVADDKQIFFVIS